jgi:uncharacterized protein (DUF1778 family)
VTDTADDSTECRAMTVPAEVFDELLAALDQPAELTPALENALIESRFENR